MDHGTMLMLPSSVTQQRLYVLFRSNPDSHAYNVTVPLAIDGVLPVGRWRAAVEVVVARHEALRTTLRLVDGQVSQCVDDEPRFTFETMEFDDESAPAHLAALREFKTRPFDLEGGPLMRCLVATGPNRQEVIVCVHHAVCDAISMNIILRELRQLLVDADADLPTPELQFADYAAWEQAALDGSRMSGQVAEWVSALSGVADPHRLPTDGRRTANSVVPAGYASFVVDGERADRVRRLARSLRGSEFAVYLGLVQLWLHKLTGQPKVAVGVPAANRTDARLDDVVGCFANTFAIPFDATRATTAAECVGATARLLREALAEQSVPFDQIVSGLRADGSLGQATDERWSPVFQVSLTYQDSPIDLAPIAGLPVTPLELGGATAKFDVQIGVSWQDGALHGTVLYDSELFTEATMSRRLDYLTELLDIVVDAPETPVLDLPAATAAERELVLGFAGSAGEPADLLPVHRLFERCVDAAPDAPAVLFGQEVVPYGELEARANRVAQLLIGMGVGRGSLVGVCLPRGVDLVVAVLGVLKAGAAYVPLDPGYPRARLEFVVADASVEVVVSSADGPAFGVPVVSVDGPGTFDGVSAQRPDRVVTSADAAYVIYTSGSTGRPKGAVIEHRSCANLFSAVADALGCGPGETWSSVHSISFDFSVWEILGCLCGGGRLAVLTTDEARDPALLAAALERYGVTLLSQTPSAFRALVDGAGRGPRCLPASVRWVVFGGEALDATVLRPWYGETSPPCFVNMYGITEATVHETVRVVPLSGEDESASVVGRPLPGLRVAVVDAGGGLVGVGVVGELLIGGVGVARGYVGRPGLTAERFVPDGFFGSGGRLYRTGDLVRWRADGVLEFVGRADDQVKVRGFRVELGEVEAVVGACPGVGGCVALVREDLPGVRRLVAYVSGVEVDVAVVREWVVRRLPGFMVPSVFVVVDSFPLTVNGKVDRSVLPAPEGARSGTEFVAPRSETEQVLARVWAEVLGLDRVGVFDNFFELGGDSMLSLRVSAALESHGYHLPINALLSGAPLAELAADSLRSAEGTAAAPVDDSDDYPATPLQLGMLAAGSEYYHDVFTYRIPLPLRMSALRAVVVEVSNRHPALRTWFDLAELPPMARIATDHEPAVRRETEPLPADETARTARLRRFRTQETHAAFPDGEPPLRFVVHTDPNPDAFYLTLSFHHALLDGWSVARLVDELAHRYAARVDGTDIDDSEPPPHLMPRYAASVRAAQRSPDTVRFWQEEAHRVRSVLPPDTERVPFEQAVHVLDRDVVDGLTELARELRCGARTLFLAVLLQVLAEQDETDTVTVGTVTHGRPAVTGAENALGLFLNTVPLTVSLPDADLAKAVVTCQTQEASAHPHHDLPYARIRALVGGELRYNFNYTHFASRAAGGLYGRYDGAGFLEQTDLPVLVSVSQDVSASAVRIRVGTTVADPTRSPEELLNAYVEALHAAAPVSGSERPTTDGHGVPESDVPAGLVPVHRLFERCVDTAPAAPAVLSGQQVVSYEDLETRANRVAQLLIGMGVGRGSLVGICVPRGVEMVVAVLGVLKAGAGYVPLDPAYPRARLEFVVADAGVEVVVAVTGGPTFGVPVVSLDEPGTFDGVSAQRPDRMVTGDDAAYVLYTSGSTGKPKGVLVQHDSCANLVAWARGQRGGQATSTLLSTSLNFDLSVYELWLPLTSGGWTRVVEDILRWAIEDHADQDPPAVLNTVPSLLDQVFRETDVDLRGMQVNLGGESTPPHVLQGCVDRGADGVLNVYGPTEATVYAVWTRQEVGQPQVVGRPLPGLRVAVVDAGGGLVGVGVVGELLIGGVGVARGYVGRPGLTAERFVPDGFFGSGGRLYRTGDLVRWRADGVLEFVGRADDQVKVRGFRVELGEVEAVVGACPGVGGCVALVREDLPGVRRLVAYVSGVEVDVAVVREWVVRRLPGFMVPSVFVVVDSFPLTVNGKVDRSVLPAPEGARSGTEFVAPRSETEQVLARVWAEVLGLDRVGVFDNFFELGGDSIQAMQIAARATRLGVRLTQDLVFTHETVARVAEALQDPRRADGDAGDAVPSDKREGLPRPLAPMQEGMLFHSLLQADEGAYVQQMVWRLPATSDWTLLRAAWAAVVARHDILRTGFRWADGEHMTQRVSAESDIPAAVLDWQSTSAAALEAELTDFLLADRVRGFVLDRPPLMRLTRIDLADGALLVWTHHHAVLDGWSIPILLAEIDEEYRRQELGTAAPPAPPQFGTFLDWLATRDPEAGEAHWRTRLESFTGARSLGAIDLRPARAARRETRHTAQWVSDETDAGLRALARRARVTLNTVVTGAWAVLLARWDAKAEAVFGAVVSGRHDGVPDAQQLVGLCMNTVPVRIPVPDQASVGTWLRRIQDARLADQDHEWMPLTAIQRTVGATREHPLFSTTLVYENFPDAATIGRSGLFGAPLRTDQHTANGVMLVVLPDPKLRLRLSVSDTGLTEDDLAEVLAEFVGLLDRLAATTVDDEVGGLRVLDDTARAWVLARSTGAVVPRDHVPVPEWFARQAAATPDAVALVHDGRRMTYRELDERSNRLANHLTGLGTRRGAAVGVCLLRGFDLVVGLLGVLKAGAHYVPLEPGHPRKRSDYVLRDAHVRTLVTSREVADHLPEFDGPVVLLGGEDDPLAAASGKAPGTAVRANELAYVIYTSGSTGKPKGVMIEHGALSNFVSWCLEGYAGERPGGTAVFSSIAFDAVVPNVYPPLVSGRSVTLLPEPLDGDALGDLLHAGAPYAFLKLTPSHFAVLAQQLGPDRARGLAHLLVVGAEAFPGSTLNEWRAFDPDVTILNEYGPTEATVANSTYVTGASTDADLLPIGVPIPNTTMYVLDDDLRLCPPGVIGELYIGGECVALGYHGLPARTAASFVPDPYGSTPGARMYRTGDFGRLLPDGNLDFRGRIDDQVKVRGYRIELAEIEGALVGHRGVEDAFVRVLDFASGPRIVAYVAGPAAELPDAAELRAFLAEELPAYMHPAHFVPLDRIPLTPHGKIDRAALPAPVVEAGPAEPTESRTAVEELLAGVWATVLGLDHVGLDDNFFELGGDSILSIRIVALAASQGVRTDLRSLFSGPTLRQLARTAQVSDTPPPARERAASGDVPLTPVQRWFFEQDVANPHHFNQWMSFRLARRNKAAVREALTAVVAEHDAFRLRYRVDDDGVNQRYEELALTDGEWLADHDLAGRVHGRPEQGLAEASGIANKLQRGLDLHYGPLLRAAFVDLGEPDDIRLIVVVHHLVVDGVSWRILAEDLEIAAAASAAGRPPTFGPRSASFGEWARRLVEFGASTRPRAEESHWLAQFEGFEPLFTPSGTGRNLAGDARSHVGALHRAPTASLLRELPRRRGVRINGVLLTALSEAVRTVLGRDDFVVNLEGHGREPLFDDVDLTRTVGWFTSIFPVRLGAAPDELAETLSRIDGLVRSIPANGVGFGALRYLSEGGGALARDVDVCFNYLGQFDGLSQPDGMLSVIHDITSGSVDRGNRRAHRLEIVSSVSDGRLTTRWTFDPEAVTPTTVASLADAYDAALRALVELGEKNT